MTPPVAVAVEHLSKVWPDGIKALDDVSLEVREGEFLAVLGLSGSGKSTLLRCINRLVDPTAGRISIFGRDVTGAEGAELRALRREVGMIFQQFNLVKRHTVRDNVLSGALGRTGTLRSLLLLFPEADRAEAQACLERVGMGDRGESRADALS